MRILLRILLVVTCALLAAGALHAGQWAQKYGGAGGFSAASMELTADGGYVFVWATQAHVGANAKVWGLKLVADGHAAWQKSYVSDRDLIRVPLTFTTLD